MSTSGPPEKIQEGKKKRRVKKKAPLAGKDAAPAIVAERPKNKAPLSTNDREVYDYVREATSKNVWCVPLMPGQSVNLQILNWLS